MTTTMKTKVVQEVKRLLETLLYTFDGNVGSLKTTNLGEIEKDPCVIVLKGNNLILSLLLFHFITHQAFSNFKNFKNF